jgi:hypothetical protein
MPSMAARMLIPARIMTASWLVKTCTSFAPGPKARVSVNPFFFFPSPPAGASDRMYSPRARSCSDAAPRFAAASTPAVTLPAAFFDS